MFSLVTSFTKENIPHAIAPSLAPCVLSVVLNKTNKPEDMKLMPYEDVIACNERSGLKIKNRGDRFIAVDKFGKSDKKSHPTEVAARLAYWQFKMNGGKSKKRNVSHNLNKKSAPKSNQLALA